MRALRPGRGRAVTLKDLRATDRRDSIPLHPMETPSRTPFDPLPETGLPGETADAMEPHYDLIGRRNDQEKRRMFTTGLAAAAAAGVYFGATAQVEDPIHRALGLVIFALALWPALEWVRSGGSRFPVFEPMMALCVNAYALPLLQGSRSLTLYTTESITLAALAVIIYQVTAIAAYRLTGGRPARGRFWAESILTQKAEGYVSYGLVASSLYFGVSAFSRVIPSDIESVLRAVFSGVSILCTFITCQRWGRGDLNRTEKWIFGSLIVAQLLIQATGLMLIGSMTQVGIALLGYLSAGRNLPLFTVGATFSLLAILHNGKSEMRDQFWTPEERRRPAISQIPSFYVDWIANGLNPPERNEQEDDLSASARLLDRASLMHMLGMIVEYTPDRQPYLNGETYSYVLPQLIPRLLWPDKPPSHVATNRLSIYYGLQSEEATVSTTIAFGMPAEAYANFGLIGMAGLGLLFGFGLKKIQVLGARSPMFSLAGITMILLTAWSLNAEFTMAVWVSSLFQALIVALGVPLVLRGILGD
jgi:hypothetical protein